MATRADFVEYVIEQIAWPGRVSTRKMFGEYALYLDGKVVALICDNTVYIKATDALRPMAEKLPMAPPYPGAKLHHAANEWLDEPQTLRQALETTAAALPPPKPRPPPARRGAGASKRAARSGGRA